MKSRAWKVKDYGFSYFIHEKISAGILSTMAPPAIYFKDA